MVQMSFDDVKQIYFLGIGGIGMSALARYFLKEKKLISGYDSTSTVLTKKLESEGMKIHYEENVDLIPDNIDLVIYTPAIPADNKEYVWLNGQGQKLYKRSEILGFISQEKKTVAIAGTHGKTTTCSILSYLLKSSGIDISSFVGGIMKNYESNYLHGTSEWMVVEADEYDRSFLRLHPDIAVILAMDADHLDIYGDKTSMHQGFQDFSLNIKTGGQLWIEHSLLKHVTDEWMKKLENRSVTVHTYGLESGDLVAQDIEIKSGRFAFDLKKGLTIKDFSLELAGRHNVSNAVVACAVANQLGCNFNELRDAINSFKGIKRRFEIVAECKEKVLIDDYAHHPAELEAAIKAARELYPGRHLTGIFQPHLFSRTRDFVNEFGEALSRLDQLFLTEIYPARELPIEGVTSQVIYDKVNAVNKKNIAKRDLIKELKQINTEIIMVLGAGDIDKEVKTIAKEIIHA